MNSLPVLEARSLTRRFDGFKAVDNVDLRIDPGELRCLIGPNGAGKSTLFKCLTGQLRPSSGRVFMEGREITRMSSHMIARQRIAIKNQIPDVFGGLSIYENLWLAGRRHHGGQALKQAVARMISVIDIPEDSHRRKVENLSHAHRQWVELGMILITDPALVLLDEPTAGMTQDETMRTAAIIRRLNQRAAVIVVEHDLEFIASLASNVTVLHQGRVLCEGRVDDVMRDQRVRDVYIGQKLECA